MSLRGAIYGTTILTRSEIGLVPPRSTTQISAPEMVTAHYAGPTDWRQSGIDRSSPARFRDTTDHARCAAIMRAHQAFHMNNPDRMWSDYAYSGAACPHGVGFIGRGRGIRTAAQGTTDGNNRSYAIQYMGAGPDDPLTDEAKRAFIDFADYLGEPLRRGHRDWKSTSCPGDLVYAWRLAGFPKVAGGTIPKTKEWDEMATQAEVEAAVVSGTAKALDSQAKRVFGITSWEAYMEALIDAARKGSRTGVSDERLHQAANDALRAVLDFEAGAKQGPLHDIVRQVLAEDDTPAPPS